MACAVELARRYRLQRARAIPGLTRKQGGRRRVGFARGAEVQFVHVRGGCPVLVRNFFSESLEDDLKGARASDDYAGVYDSQVEQQPEIIQIAVKERVLIVPLDFESDTSLEAVDLVVAADLTVQVRFWFYIAFVQR
jgi:hypothetical protein